MKALVFALGLGVTLSACAQTPEVPPVGRIYGEVWRASSCGARRSEEEQKRLGCEPRPVQTAISVAGIDGRQVATVASDEKGQFEVSVPAGEYTLRVTPEGSHAGASARTAVAAGESREVWLHLSSLLK